MSRTGPELLSTVDGVLTTPALLAAASGLALGLGLIVAIGAQNAFVLRQGLRLEHVTAVVAVCALSDLALIGAGVLGAGAALTRAPWLIPAVCFVGAAFLLGYGLLAARRALRPGALRPDAAGAGTGLAVTVASCLALTWLNPHVYLDTVLLLGSMAATHGEHRWQLASTAPAAAQPAVAAYRVGRDVITVALVEASDGEGNPMRPAQSRVATNSFPSAGYCRTPQVYSAVRSRRRRPSAVAFRERGCQPERCNSTSSSGP